LGIQPFTAIESSKSAGALQLQADSADLITMIRLTRLNHEPLVVNSDLIEVIECRPDTTIALTTGQKVLVLESPDEIVRLVIAFRRSLSKCPLPTVDRVDEDPRQAVTPVSALSSAITLKA
jgi:flagellar protein FlbD